jgi:ATP-dependent RNA helicase DeaD
MNMTKFEEFGLSPELMKGVVELGFSTPTPVQAKVIPMLIKGARDVVALAQTGTGKTAAFGFPLLQLTDPKNPATQALVLCPTRELCMQISKDLSDYGRFAPHLKILAVYGGSPIYDQIRALRHGIHIIVATPGRMKDLLNRKSANLAGVQRVVLDEADEMLNMGFQEELESILATVPDTARTLLFSATMPKQVAAIARKYMNDPEEIIIGQRNAGAPNVTHECYTVHASDRYHALKRIIDCLPVFYGIIFCRTRIETQDIASQLMADGYSSDALHGDMSQDQRDRVMHNFRKRNIKILVATDVAARGLDVDDLTHVINYDLPGDPDVYTHRSGRTGRAGKAGISIVLVHMREDFKIRAIERIMNKKFEHKQVPTGKQVCETHLVTMLEKVKGIDIAETAKLNPYLPKINEIIADMPREELIKRFVLGEFNSILEYYKDAPDLNVNVGHGQRNDRFERRDRNDRGGQQDRNRSSRDSYEGPMSRLRINVGKLNGMTVPTLIGLINRATHGPMLKLGRIRLMDQSSVFEIEGGSEDNLMQNLSKGNFKDRQLKCVPDSGDSHTHGSAPRNEAPPTPSKPQVKPAPQPVNPAPHPVKPAPHPVKPKKAPPAPPQNVAKSRKERLNLELQKMESDLMARLKSL